MKKYNETNGVLRHGVAALLGAALLLSGAARAQSSSSTQHTSSEQTMMSETTTAPAPAPNPLDEQREPITANKNLIVEDKAVGGADHDYMPSPATIPNPAFKAEADRGNVISQQAPTPDELVSTRPESMTPSSTKGPYYDVSENELRARKFFRGAGNVLLCVGEVPNQMFQEAYKTSPITGVVVGAGKGLWKGAKRFMIGTWEMFTFYNPGANHYQPYIQPEVVFQEYTH